jgi:hypothetical protein
VLIYGIFGLISAYGLLRRRRWSLRTVSVRKIAASYVPGIAVTAYAVEEAILASAMAASVGSLLRALGVVWTTKVMTRGTHERGCCS